MTLCARWLLTARTGDGAAEDTAREEEGGRRGAVRREIGVHDMPGMETNRPKGPRRARRYGRFIVVDAAVCHGKPVFRGTRGFVADVIEQVEAGMPREAIQAEWRGTVSAEAISRGRSASPSRDDPVVRQYCAQRGDRASGLS